MRKNYILIIIVFLLCIPTFVMAAEVEIAGTVVAIRNKPSTSGTKYTALNSGDRLVLKNTNKVADQGGCSAGWYNVDYQGQDAYVCSTYARVIQDVVTNIDTTSCQTELRSKGFPQAYIDKLCVLKSKYPNWTFDPVNTGLDFKTAVEKESACGKNTINTSNATYKDLSCTGSYDSGYVSASQTAVANFMNPLNYLTESGIFMFESNYVNQNITNESYNNIVPNILSSFMLTSLPSLKNALNNAARNKNVSQVLLSARIKQEIGTGKATSNTYAGGLLSCICGQYTTRWGTTLNGQSLDNYYNFFNIGVYDGSNGDAAYRAVVYAKNSGWGGTGNQETDLTLAIGGGADFLKNRYLDKGQNTIYFQKFNVAPVSASSLYVNQYMTNVQAPSSESSIVYNAYKNSNMLNSPFVFKIPVFNNMNDVITNSSNGATGESGTNTSGGMAVETILASSGLSLSGSTISGIAPGTSIDDINNKISALGGKITGDTSGLVGTGKKIKISNGSSEKEFTFVVKGDTSGDGIINALDLLQIQKNILNQYSLNNEFKVAADPSGDGVVNALDLLQIQKHILGQYKIG